MCYEFTMQNHESVGKALADFCINERFFPEGSKHKCKIREDGHFGFTLGFRNAEGLLSYTTIMIGSNENSFGAGYYFRLKVADSSIIFNYQAGKKFDHNIDRSPDSMINYAKDIFNEIDNHFAQNTDKFNETIQTVINDCNSGKVKAINDKTLAVVTIDLEKIYTEIRYGD